MRPEIDSRNYRCIYFRVFSSSAAARRNDAVTWVHLCKHQPVLGPYRGTAAQTPRSEMPQDSWNDMQSLQTVSITPCHTLPTTAHVKCTHKNRHWKAKIAPVSDLTICYLSLHCWCSLHISSGHQPHRQTMFSNICFRISFSCFTYSYFHSQHNV